MKELICTDFQDTVENAWRHRSILDILTNYKRLALGVTVLGCVTCCGCVEVKAQRQRVPANASLRSR